MMALQRVAAESTFESWRDSARHLLVAGIAPANVVWHFELDAGGDLFDVDSDIKNATQIASPKVPRAFLDLAQRCVCHSDPERFRILYALLFECVHEPSLLENAAHPLVHKTQMMAKSVSRDMHKMKAFVRFREEDSENRGRRSFTAWFEPEHYIVQPTSEFFRRRFTDMDWTIATPKGSAMLAGSLLTFDPMPAEQIKSSDETEELWKTYYANIFNPARLKVDAMRSEMPKKYWHNLPEAVLIPALIATAEKRAGEMHNASATMPAAFANAARAPSAPRTITQSETFASLHDLNTAARQCQRCPLYCNATQTVVGEGLQDARLMIVGEQPGDEEDLRGKPFVGPAGLVLDNVLALAQIERAKIYLTNAVKHFKFEARGKRRIHQRPTTAEIQHCKFWLNIEVDLVRPTLIVAMGATASGALTGNDKNITGRRGKIESTAQGIPVLVTYHPAAILRAPTPEKSHEMKSEFITDFEMAVHFLATHSDPAQPNKFQ